MLPQQHVDDRYLLDTSHSHGVLLMMILIMMVYVIVMMILLRVGQQYVDHCDVIGTHCYYDY